MVIVIKKGQGKKEIDAAVKRLRKKRSSKPTVADFYGKLKGAFGDGLTYQKNARNEWD